MENTRKILILGAGGAGRSTLIETIQKMAGSDNIIVAPVTPQQIIPRLESPGEEILMERNAIWGYNTIELRRKLKYSGSFMEQQLIKQELNNFNDNSCRKKHPTKKRKFKKRK